MSKTIFITDQNFGNYGSGQIIFDFNKFGSNKYLDLSKSYIVVPYVVSMRSDQQLTENDVSPFAIGIKSSFTQIVNDISIEYDKTSLTGNQRYSNVFTNYKLLHSFDVQDVNKYASLIGFYPDTADSTIWIPNPSVAGIGYINNTDSADPSTLFKLQANTSFGLRKRMTTVFGLEGQNSTLPTQPIDVNEQACRSTFAEDGTGTFTWVIYCILRLKDLSDFFENIPEIKIPDCRLIINTNTFDLTIRARSKLLSIASYNQLSGQCCPIMFGGSEKYGDSTYPITQSDRDIYITGGIMGNRLSTKKASLNSCRLYIPTREVTIVREPTLVKYHDFYHYLYTVPKLGNFNKTLITGLRGVKSIVVLPFPHTNTTEVFSVGPLISDWQSPFSSSPATSSGIVLKDFNVSVGGINVLADNIQYDFSMYIDEVSKIFGSYKGLVDYYAWQEGYRAYIVDVSHMSVESNNAIVVSFNNPLNIEIDVMCFVIYEKSIKVDNIGRILN